MAPDLIEDIVAFLYATDRIVLSVSSAEKRWRQMSLVSCVVRCVMNKIATAV